MCGIYNCRTLLCVALHSTEQEVVTEIREFAFYGCKNLRGVKIPDSVTEIGEEAFRDCRSLTSVTIPEGVTKIGESAFYNCKNLRGVTIPDSVTEMGEEVFGKDNEEDYYYEDNSYEYESMTNPIMIRI